MNIGFIINNLSFGGAEKMATFVANSLAQRGHKISIFLLSNKGNIHQEINKNISVYYYNKTRNKNIYIQYYNWLKYIKPLVKKENTQVLVSFLGIPNLVCTILGKLLNIPSIISERGDPYTAFSDGRLVTKILLWIYNHSNGAVFQTEEASKFYNIALQKRSKVIPNPIFINGRIPTINYDDLPKTIVYIGRLDNYQKRIDILLAGFYEFYKNHNEYRLVIYGRGPSLSYIEEYIRNNSLSKCVDLKGVSTSPMEDMAKEGIFVITSDFEGISNSLLEAMAIGMPVVTTDHSPGGGRLLVQDHKNGIIVPRGNPHYIANALSEFADNPTLCRRCGLEATKVIQRFESKKIITIWESYIAEVFNLNKHHNKN